MDLPLGLGLGLFKVHQHGEALGREKLPVDERVVAPLVLAADKPVLGLGALARGCFFRGLRAHDHLEGARAEHEPDAGGLDGEEDGEDGREQKARDLGGERVSAEGDVGEGRGGVESEPDRGDAVGGGGDDGGEGLGRLLGGRRLLKEFELLDCEVVGVFLGGGRRKKRGGG